VLPARASLLLYSLLPALCSPLLAQQPSAPAAPDTAVILGTVYDTLSGAPLRLVIVRVVESGLSALTDDAGRYRVTGVTGGTGGAPGVLHLIVRHIGYEPESLSVTAPAGVTRQDVYLRPAAVPLAPVTVTSDDDPARRIVQAAIARKHGCSDAFTTTAMERT